MIWRILPISNILRFFFLASRPLTPTHNKSSERFQKQKHHDDEKCLCPYSFFLSSNKRENPWPHTINIATTSVRRPKHTHTFCVFFCFVFCFRDLHKNRVPSDQEWSICVVIKMRVLLLLLFTHLLGFCYGAEGESISKICYADIMCGCMNSFLLFRQKGYWISLS